jgi:hypothetical protein
MAEIAMLNMDMILHVDAEAITARESKMIRETIFNEWWGKLI